MHDKYLEITFRKGKPLAAYLYLSRKSGTKAVKSKKYEEGIIVDFDGNNSPIGLEITSPIQIHISEINKILELLNISPISEKEFAPLKAA